MKVMCVNNSGNALPENIYSFSKNAEFQITIGKEYTVYGIETFKRFPWYLVCEDHYDSLIHKYPKFIYSGCFKITDRRLSKFWRVGESQDIYSLNERTIAFGFEEMLNNNEFYPRLIEGGFEKEENIFITIKQAMDNEFF